MTATPEPAGPREWTPGAGWARVKREMPHIVPEITDEDERNLDRLLSDTDQPTPAPERTPRQRRGSRLGRWVRRTA